MINCYKITYISCLVAFAFLLSMQKIAGQPVNRGEQSFVLVRMLDKFHYAPRVIDDTFSAQVVDNFIQSLDAASSIFNKADIAAIRSFDSKVDDELLSRSDEFLSFVTALYREKLLSTDSLISSISSTSLDFSEKDSLMASFVFTGRFAADEKERAKKWKRRLKYRVLTSKYGSFDSTSTVTKTGVLTRSDAQIIEAVRQKEHNRISKVLDAPQGFEEYVANLYLNAIAACYDPHTEFFSRTEVEQFENELSTEAPMFGFTIDENNNEEIEIVKLKPGSPAWKCNKLKTGDILLQVAWGNGKGADFTNIDIETANELINSIPAETITMTVRKADGSPVSVTLTKEMLKVDENSITGYILGGKRTVGYISLPDFYTSAWDSGDVVGCSNDVAKEIVKLQKENIEGLIIDLRYNGGGSLPEAVNLAGIFVDQGPVGIYRTRSAKPILMKDMNRGAIYNGPLVLLVNGESASASEILSASLQDYHQAIIVGSRTFGKATGQVILPLDTTVNLDTANDTESAKYGYAKLTVEKIYRVTGATHQHVGVIPDVVLPDILDYYNDRESELPHSLPADTIAKKIFFSPRAPLPVAELAAKSIARTSRDSGFVKIKKFNVTHPGMFLNDRIIPLETIAFNIYMNNEYADAKSVDDLYSRLTSSFIPRSNAFYNETISSDTTAQSQNKEALRFLSEDLYIDESYRILDDYLDIRDHSQSTQKQ